MEGPNLAGLVEVGRIILIQKLFVTSIHILWIYDYLLTLRDEIDYAWSGRKSRLLALFVAVRYLPVYYIVWVLLSGFNPSKSHCQKAKWLPIFHTTIITVIAQVVVTLRVYGATGRNKLLGIALSALVMVMPPLGFYYTVKIAMAPVPPLPDINLDAYRACPYERWRLGEFLYAGQTSLFDIIAFLAIVTTAYKSQGMRYPGIPSLLDILLRDSTKYFVLIFTFQASFLFFLFFAPGEIQLLPAIANTILVSIMASRLMLSLKKASLEPRGPWSLETISHLDDSNPSTNGTLRFASSTMSVAREVPEAAGPSTLDEGEIELNLVFPISLRK